ncbi:alpha/beta hydrolase [Paenibacillus borealis]|uniref:alpha/beta hydrolase n=1 Tax=Paenibacillus borealis TaxID=160799 RepID=UPI000693BA9F|nr:alpha/beta hydrolase [Paenibacillus borealis]
MNKSIQKFRIGRKTGITLSIIAFLIIAIIVVNQLTPRPFVAIFRALISTQENAVNAGPYAEQIKDVEVSDLISIPVEGLPDAQITLYTSGAESDTPKPLILFIHGGGWTAGNAKQVGSFSKLLASEGYVVASLDYSLAPEYRYPAPIQQAAAAIHYLQTHAEEYNADPAKLFIGGNSAGAQISSQLGAMITNPALEQQVGVNLDIPAANVKGLLLLNGVYDFDTVARDKFPGFRKYAWSYTGQKDYENYSRLDELSTVKNITSEYPPSYITAGDADPLEPQTYEMDAILRAHGVDVTSVYWTGSGNKLPHDYIYQLDKEPAQTAYEEVVKFLNDKSQQ